MSQKSPQWVTNITSGLSQFASKLTSMAISSLFILMLFGESISITPVDINNWISANKFTVFVALSIIAIIFMLIDTVINAAKQKKTDDTAPLKPVKVSQQQAPATALEDY